MRTPLRWCLMLVSIVVLVGGSVRALGEDRVAGDDPAPLQVVVTSVSGQSVFIDKGRLDGVTAGMDLVLHPSDGSTIHAVITIVSAGSSRADLPSGVEVPSIGTTGEVMLPTSAAPPPDEPAPDGAVGAPEATVPEHPPWKTDLSGVSPDEPLLAPVSRQKPEDRPTKLSGRAYINSRLTHDGGSGRDATFTTVRMGASFTVRNLLRDGGRFRFDGETAVHHDMFTGRDSETEVNWRLERLSYAFGGEDYAPYRIEFGRFYSIYLPELGLIDGAEAALQLTHGFTIGAGAGMIPLNNRDRDWDGDFGAHVFVNYESEKPGFASATLGYQKTWHDWEADRDQVVGRVNLRPNDQLWLLGSFRADIYDSGDEIKGPGVELTELWTQVRYTPVKYFGASAGYSRFRWPELERGDYRLLPVEIIENGRVDRMSLSAWMKPIEDLRFTASFDYWEDETNDGTSGDLTVDWSGFGPDYPSLRATGFFVDGNFNSGSGFRFEARQQYKSMSAYLGYEFFQYDGVATLGGDDSHVRNLVRGGVGWYLGKWYLDFSGDYYFGEEDDVYTLGLYISYRF